MKFDLVKKMIEDSKTPPKYLVYFEKREGNFLRGDSFPEKNDTPSSFDTEDEAWEWAEKFAALDLFGKKYVNIYVVYENFMPVPNYNDKILNSY